MLREPKNNLQNSLKIKDGQISVHEMINLGTFLTIIHFREIVLYFTWIKMVKLN